MTEEREVLTVRADHLLPGDIVLDDQGKRFYAVFDVRVRVLSHGGTAVDIWTARTDHLAGIAPMLRKGGSMRLAVSRRVGGPQVTRTTL
jgi:hypothetical protein